MMKVHLFRHQKKNKQTNKPQETILYPWQTLRRHGLLEKESESQRRQVEH